LTAGWVRDSAAAGTGIGWSYINTAAFDTAETAYGVDFNQNGIVGAVTPIESVGTTVLNRDTSGRVYAGTAPIFVSTGNHLTLTSLNGYTPVAVEDFGVNGGKRLVLKHSGGSLLVWGLTAGWVRDSAAAGTGIGWSYINTAAFDTAETAYGVDFNQNGTIGRVL
jgi:hypothetical protein